MFTKASLRLAAWYVAILMGLSLAFSFWVYNEAMLEVRQSFEGPIGWHIDSFDIEDQQNLSIMIDQQIQAGQQRILGRLVVLNLAILAIGGIVSYWLARQTLQPIEEAVESQKRFTADASHELRTPLAAMKTEIEVALRSPNLENADARALLQSNLEEVNRMSGLAEGLLTMARSDKQPRLSAVHADKVVAAVCKRLAVLAAPKNIKIKYSSSPLKVMANAKYVDTIVGILVDNAIKYSPSDTRITIQTTQQDGKGQIVVKDQGLGIAEPDVMRIFERFYRADSSRSKEHVSGHGLGLSIAQKMAVSIHGTISVQSKPGKGSVFTLQLPLAQ